MLKEIVPPVQSFMMMLANAMLLVTVCNYAIRLTYFQLNTYKSSDYENGSISYPLCDFVTLSDMDSPDCL